MILINDERMNSCLSCIPDCLQLEAGPAQPLLSAFRSFSFHVLNLDYADLCCSQRRLNAGRLALPLSCRTSHGLEALLHLCCASLPLRLGFLSAANGSLCPRGSLSPGSQLGSCFLLEASLDFSL